MGNIPNVCIENGGSGEKVQMDIPGRQYLVEEIQMLSRRALNVRA